MNCCSNCAGAENIFDDSRAKKDLENYRENGPSKQTQLLIETVRALDIDGMTLIDIGGGVGAIQHAMAEAGAQQIISIDASSAYLEAARREAEQQGYADRVAYHYGDFVMLAENLEPADVVTLDRVICCYPDMPALVGLSVGHARKIYALVMPRESWWVKLGIGFINLFQWLRRDPFRVFAHRTAAVDAIITEHGFQSRLHEKGWFWQVMVYTR